MKPLPADEARIPAELRAETLAEVGEGVWPSLLEGVQEGDVRQLFGELELDVLLYPDIGMDPASYYLTFAGKFRGTHEQEHHLHESPPVMTMIGTCETARIWRHTS